MNIQEIIGASALPILMGQVSVTKILDAVAAKLDECGDRFCGQGGNVTKNGRRQLSEFFKVSPKVRRSHVKYFFDQPDPSLLFFFPVVAGASEDKPPHAVTEQNDLLHLFGITANQLFQ